MSCKACEEFQESSVTSWFRWKNANVEVRACEDHLREVFNALRDAQHHGALVDAAPDLLRATTAAWHLCESLLASPGATRELIEEVRDACVKALAKAKGRE